MAKERDQTQQQDYGHHLLCQQGLREGLLLGRGDVDGDLSCGIFVRYVRQCCLHYCLHLYYESDCMEEKLRMLSFLDDY